MSVNDDENMRPSEIDRLIHEPARYSIVALLYVVQCAEFLFVQNHTRLTPGNLSAHIGKLETAKYLEIEKKFMGKKPRTFLKLTKLGRNAFEKYQAIMKALLARPPVIEVEMEHDNDES